MARLVSRDLEHIRLMGARRSTWFPPRHHREHVDGDYRTPPPHGKYDALKRRSIELMKREPVFLSHEQCLVVLKEMWSSLAHHNITVAAVSVGPLHTHVIAKYPRGRRTATGKLISDPARHFTGIARKNAARLLTDRGEIALGGIWSKRTKIEPIVDQSHFRRAVPYVLDHAREGALVWCPLTVLERVRAMGRCQNVSIVELDER